MKTAFCPISDKRINENTARGNAFLTVLLLAAYMLTSNLLIPAFLFADFLFRSLDLTKFSPFAFLSTKINQWLKINPKIINAGPKIFSARIGVVFSLLILLTALPGWQTVAMVLTTVFLICAFLEAVFAFCVACQIYPFVYRLYYK